jgi:hypothetical protein
MIKILLSAIISVILISPVLCQTQNDTIFNYLTTSPVTIDGQATEECWANAEWHAIDQVWIPFNATMQNGDFEGRFKVAWDELYLYVLVEVIDDSLSDDHSNPLSNWWDDDCLEVFIDENRSKGDHELNNNAFAYHVSLFYDAVDLNSSGQGVNYMDNIEVKMDTIGEDTNMWEFAIKNYNASFNMYNPERSRVLLEHNKKMGFTIAYCDNDETISRENFIGSMKMTAATHNDMYKNADHFGLMLLIDPDYGTGLQQIPSDAVKIYPSPAQNYINIESQLNGPTQVVLSSLTGQQFKNESFRGNSHILNIADLDAGIYILQVVIDNQPFAKIVVKQ